MRTLLLLLLTFVSVGAHAKLSEAACTAVIRQAQVMKHDGESPDQRIYRFKKLHDMILDSVEDGDRTECLFNFYENGMEESKNYWVDHLDEAGCTVRAGEFVSIEGRTCNTKSQAVHSLKYLSDLHQDLRTKMRAAVDASRDKRREDAASSRRPVCSRQSAIEQLTDSSSVAGCCGDPQNANGMIEAVWPGTSYNKCLEMHGRDRESLLSTAGACIKNLFLGVVKGVWDSIKGLASLWKMAGALGKLGSYVSDAKFRQQTNDALWNGITEYFRTQVGGFQCMNAHYRTDFICEKIGTIVGMLAAPDPLSKVLGLVGKPLAMIAKGIGDLMKGTKAGMMTLRLADKSRAALARTVEGARNSRVGTAVTDRLAARGARRAESRAAREADLAENGPGRLSRLGSAAAAPGRWVYKAGKGMVYVVQAPLSAIAERIAGRIAGTQRYMKLIEDTSRFRNNAASRLETRLAETNAARGGTALAAAGDVSASDAAIGNVVRRDGSRPPAAANDNERFAANDNERGANDTDGAPAPAAAPRASRDAGSSETGRGAPQGQASAPGTSGAPQGPRRVAEPAAPSVPAPRRTQLSYNDPGAPAPRVEFARGAPLEPVSNGPGSVADAVATRDRLQAFSRRAAQIDESSPTAAGDARELFGVNRDVRVRNADLMHNKIDSLARDSAITPAEANRLNAQVTRMERLASGDDSIRDWPQYTGRGARTAETAAADAARTDGEVAALSDSAKGEATAAGDDAAGGRGGRRGHRGDRADDGRPHGEEARGRGDDGEGRPAPRRGDTAEAGPSIRRGSDFEDDGMTLRRSARAQEDIPVRNQRPPARMTETQLNTAYRDINALDRKLDKFTNRSQVRSIFRSSDPYQIRLEVDSLHAKVDQLGAVGRYSQTRVAQLQTRISTAEKIATNAPEARAWTPTGVSTTEQQLALARASAQPPVADVPAVEPVAAPPVEPEGPPAEAPAAPRRTLVDRVLGRNKPAAEAPAAPVEQRIRRGTPEEYRETPAEVAARNERAESIFDRDLTPDEDKAIGDISNICSEERRLPMSFACRVRKSFACKRSVLAEHCKDLMNARIFGQPKGGMSPAVEKDINDLATAEERGSRLQAAGKLVGDKAAAFKSLVQRTLRAIANGEPVVRSRLSQIVALNAVADGVADEQQRREVALAVHDEMETETQTRDAASGRTYGPTNEFNAGIVLLNLQHDHDNTAVALQPKGLNGVSFSPEVSNMLIDSNDGTGTKFVRALHRGIQTPTRKSPVTTGMIRSKTVPGLVEVRVGKKAVVGCIDRTTNQVQLLRVVRDPAQVSTYEQSFGDLCN